MLEDVSIWEKYCWWGYSKTESCFDELSPLTSQLNTEESRARPEKKQIKRRRKRILLPDLTESIQILYKKINDLTIKGFRKCRKIDRKSSLHLSNRQSKFIGVSRNGNFWQVLKNFNQKKKYVGGYTEELEAAICYDFYSMLTDTEQARTNFDYSIDLLKEMIERFLQNNQKFQPKDYIHILVT